jgi:hypothetical protein
MTVYVETPDGLVNLDPLPDKNENLVVVRLTATEEAYYADAVVNNDSICDSSDPIFQYQLNGGTSCGICHSGTMDQVLTEDIILGRDVATPVIAFGMIAASAGGLLAETGIATGGIGFNLTDTVAGYASTRPYVNSPLTILEIMQSATPIPDPQGVPNALMWIVPGAYNGSDGVWELVVDMSTNTVLHLLFRGG